MGLGGACGDALGVPAIAGGPVTARIPPIKTIFVENDERTSNPLGAKGTVIRIADVLT
jgi:hypothetical protein